MNGFKTIPQIFFDLIGRVVPGSVFLLLWLSGFGFDSWKAFIQSFAIAEINSTNVESVLLFSLSMFILMAYVTGHLLSPLTKAIEKVSNKKINCNPADDNEENAADLVIIKHWLTFFAMLPGSLLNIKTCKEKINQLSSEYSDSPYHAYEWLRLWQPEAGGLCAKLRAEFTMYNGLAATFLIFFVLNLFCELNWAIERRFLAAIILFVLFLLMTLRGRKTRKTFSDCVKRFKVAATPLTNPA